MNGLKNLASSNNISGGPTAESPGRTGKKTAGYAVNYSSQLVPNSSSDSNSTSSNSFGRRRFGPEVVEHQVVKNNTRILNNAVVDVRAAKAVHVTSRCSHGVAGGMCGAVHQGLSAELPVFPELNGLSHHHPSITTNSSYSSTKSASNGRAKEAKTTVIKYFSHAEAEFDDIQGQQPIASRRLTVDVSALDAILADVDLDLTMENKTTTQWKSSFRGMRDKFSTAPPPAELRLSTAGLGANASSSASAFCTLPRSKMTSPTDSRPYSPPRTVKKSQSDYDIGTVVDRQRMEFGSPSPVSGGHATENGGKGVSSFWTNSLRQPDRWEDQIETSKLATNTNASKQQHPVNFAELNALMDEAAGPTQKSSSSSVYQRSYQRKSSAPLPTANLASAIENVEAAAAKQSAYSSSITVKLPSNATKKSNCEPEVNFSALDNAVEAVHEMASKQQQQLPRETTTTMKPQRPPVELQLINEVSNFLQKNVEILTGSGTGAGTGRFPVLKEDKPVSLAKAIANVTVTERTRPLSVGSGSGSLIRSHSPSPDNLESPAAMPHPKPKHHLREQLASMGMEPKSPTWNNPTWNGNGNTSAFPFTVTSTGAVADRVSLFEKFPTPKVHFSATIPGQQRAGSPPSSSLAGKANATVYRTKPIIHVNLSHRTEDHFPPDQVISLSPMSMLRYRANRVFDCGF